MTLTELQTEWSKDSEIDRTDLGAQIAQVPKLHSKYLNFLSNANMIAHTMEIEYNKLRATKRLFYKGKLSPEEIDENGFDRYFASKPKTTAEVETYLDSDADINKLLAKRAIQMEIAEYCKYVMKEINNRSWQLKSILDYEKFKQGFG